LLSTNQTIKIDAFSCCPWQLDAYLLYMSAIYIICKINTRLQWTASETIDTLRNIMRSSWRITCASNNANIYYIMHVCHEQQLKNWSSGQICWRPLHFPLDICRNLGLVFFRCGIWQLQCHLCWSTLRALGICVTMRDVGLPPLALCFPAHWI